MKVRTQQVKRKRCVLAGYVNGIHKFMRPWACLAFLLAACPERPLDQAHRLAGEGRWEAAGEAYLAVAKADPASLGAWDGAVEAWCQRLANVGQCLSVLDLELDLLGNLNRHADALAEALERRARARLEQGLAQPALDDLARAEMAAPERASVLVAKARALIALGKSQAAKEALHQAKKLDPRNAEADQLWPELPDEEHFGGE